MIEPERFRKKPVVIEALQWLPGDLEAVGVMWAWLGLQHGQAFTHADGMGDKTTLMIHTLEGDMKANPGDWVIRGTHGEFYPIAARIFAENYEAVQ